MLVLFYVNPSLKYVCDSILLGLHQHQLINGYLVVTNDDTFRLLPGELIHPVPPVLSDLIDLEPSPMVHVQYLAHQIRRWHREVVRYLIIVHTLFRKFKT